MTGIILNNYGEKNMVETVNIISLDALSEVLNEDVVFIKGVENDILFYSTDNIKSLEFIKSSITLDSLNNKCKQWLISKGIGIEIQYRVNSSTGTLSHIEISLYKGQFDCDFFDMDSDSETEGIIKACEWYLKDMKDI